MVRYNSFTRPPLTIHMNTQTMKEKKIEKKKEKKKKEKNFFVDDFSFLKLRLNFLRGKKKEKTRKRKKIKR